jgi:PAS domain S-box-containing protein
MAGDEGGTRTGGGSAGVLARSAVVLVATSDSTTRDLLGRALRISGVEVVQAADGVEALNFARTLDLDAVLLDVFLAVLDGISVCARIRSLTKADQPLILITGPTAERVVERALEAGADEIIGKPLQLPLIRHRLEVLLRRRELEMQLRLLERAMDAAASGVTILDARSPEYPVTYVNQAFVKMTGYSVEELIGKNLRMLQGPKTDVATMATLRESLAAGIEARAVLRNYRKDRSTFWNELALSPVRDSAGRLTHYVGIQTDVSARVRAGELEIARYELEEQVTKRTQELNEVLRKLDKRRQFTETILNGLTAGVITTDASGAVSFVNRTALETVQMSLADCIGRPVLEIFGNNEELQQALIESRGRSETRIDCPIVSPGGRRAYVGMTIMRAPEEFEGEYGVTLLFRDLAEDVKGEEARHGVPPSPPAEPAAPGAAPLAVPATNAPPRRPFLKMTSPVGPVRKAIRQLGFGEDGGPEVEASDGLPQLLLDESQIVEAFACLVGAAVDVVGPDGLRLRVRPGAGPGAAGGIPGFVCVDLLDSRSAAPDDERRRARRPFESLDEGAEPRLSEAQRILAANGGRLAPSADERTLVSVLLPTTTSWMTPSRASTP